MTSPSPLLLAAIAAPLILLGLWLWRDQATMISIAGFIAYCL